MAIPADGAFPDRRPRAPWRVAHPLPEILLLAACGTITDCEDYEAIAAWGEARLDFLRRFQPYRHGAPSGRWLTVFMNRRLAVEGTNQSSPLKQDESSSAKRMALRHVVSP